LSPPPSTAREARHPCGGHRDRARLEISLAGGRVFWLYGPGERPGRPVSDLVAGLLAGREVASTEGLERRDFMHVRDVAGAFVAMLTGEVAGAVNVASGQARR
jgi:nucleoside-diphosphate-sugar epimerase